MSAARGFVIGVPLGLVLWAAILTAGHAQVSGTTPAAMASAKTVNTVQQNARQTTAGAPSLQVYTASAGQSDLCVGEVSGAYGNAMLAVTLDAPERDKVCSLLRQSKWAADLGEPDLGREIMCGSADWRAAAARVGRPCLAATKRRAKWRFW